MIGTASNLFTEESMDDVNMNLISRWQRVSKQAQYFWKKFHLDYINTLNQRYKLQKVQNNLKVDDIVTVKDDNLPPHK